jgi:hypothetical protein
MVCDGDQSVWQADEERVSAVEPDDSDSCDNVGVKRWSCSARRDAGRANQSERGTTERSHELTTYKPGGESAVHEKTGKIGIRHKAQDGKTAKSKKKMTVVKDGMGTKPALQDPTTEGPGPQGSWMMKRAVAPFRSRS